MFKVTPQYDKNTNTFSISFNGEFIDEYREAFTNFFNLYEVDNLIFHPDKKPKLKPKTERKCRFCDEMMPNVKFRKDAHLIPQLMGNRNLISDFECDNCNSFFSKYENDIANFMGLSRTLSFLKGQDGLPKFKNPDKNLIVGKDDESNDPKRIKIISVGLENDHFKIDQEKKELIINSVKHPYTPIKVFKVLLKIGYSLLPENELKDYENVKKLLMSDNSDSKMSGNPFFRLLGVFSPGAPFPSPLIFCCKKREDKKDITCPTRTYVIYFQNYIYQFFMPYFDGDKWMYGKDKTITLHRMPPLLDKNWIEYFGKPGHFCLDLSSNIVKKNEEDRITMGFDAAIEDLSIKDNNVKSDKIDS